jgi:hypothetical protein
MIQPIGIYPSRLNNQLPDASECGGGVRPEIVIIRMFTNQWIPGHAGLIVQKCAWHVLQDQNLLFRR